MNTVKKYLSIVSFIFFLPVLAMDAPVNHPTLQTGNPPRLVQVQPLLSIPEVFLLELVARLQQTTFFTDIQQTPWYINNWFNNCLVSIILKGELDKLKLAVQKGVRVDRIIRSGKSLLTFAVFAQKPQMLTWLLSKGANPNTVDERGYTCLEYATHFDNAEILKRLFLCQNIPAATKIRACILIECALKPQYVEVIKSLAYYSLGLSAKEHTQFVYTLENKIKAKQKKD